MVYFTWRVIYIINITADIMNASGVCKLEMYPVPSFQRCIYMAVCYYMANYTYEDQHKATA